MKLADQEPVPNSHDDYMYKKNKAIWGKHGLPPNATWRQIMCAETNLPPDTDSKWLVETFIQFKKLDLTDSTSLQEMLDKPVNDTEIDIKSTKDLIRRLLGIDYNEWRL